MYSWAVLPFPQHELFADDLTKARLEGTSQNLIRKLNKKDLLILDDFGLQPLTLEARLAYAVTKLDEFRGDAGLLCRERVHATEVLVVCILLKLRHDRLVGHIAEVLQDLQSDLQADRFCPTSIVLAVQWGKSVFTKVFQLTTQVSDLE